MTDSQVMEASNAAINFRKLLAIDRWLQRDWAALVARHSRLPIPEEVVPANYRLHRQDELGPEPVIPAEIDRSMVATRLGRPSGKALEAPDTRGSSSGQLPAAPAGRAWARTRDSSRNRSIDGCNEIGPP